MNFVAKDKPKTARLCKGGFWRDFARVDLLCKNMAMQVSTIEARI